MADEDQIEAPAETPTETPTPSTETTETGSETRSETSSVTDTIATSSEPDDTPIAVPATWPEDWRNRFAGSNEDDVKRLNRFKDPANVWKSYRALEQRISSGEYKRSRPDPTDEEAMTAWRQEMGLPESHEGYLEGLEIPEELHPTAEIYAKEVFENGGDKDEFDRGMTSYMKYRQEALEHREQADKEYRALAEDDLRSRWGPEYRANLNAMHGLFETYGSEDAREALFSARTADGNILGDNPEIIDFLVGVAREINPFGTVVPISPEGRSEALDSEIRALEAEMNDTKGRAPDGYWNNPAKQEKYRQLIEMKERQESRRRA